MHGLGLHVVIEERHRSVAVGQEVDAVPGPHGVEVVGIGARHLGYAAVGEAGEPDARRLAAAIFLPHQERLPGGLVGDRLAVGRHRRLVSAGERQPLFHTSLDGDTEHLAETRVGGPRRSENNPLAVGHPAEDAIGSRMPGESFRHATRSGDNEDIHVAVVLAGEGDACTVRRKCRLGFITGSAREAHGVASVARHAPKVARIGKHDMGLAQRWLLQKQRFVGGGRHGGKGAKGDNETHRSSFVSRCESRIHEELSVWRGQSSASSLMSTQAERRAGRTALRGGLNPGPLCER